jgi:hypothetical protein
MALSSETSKTTFNCTGGTTYDFDFKVFEAGDLEVIRVTALGVESTLALTTGYSVSALTETGGRVTTVSTYSDGKLIVRRKQSKKQEIDYTQNDAFSTPVLEEQLDKTVMMIQEVKEQVGRCIQMPAITEEADVPDYADLIDTATVAAQDAADDASDSADAAAASAVLSQAQVALAAAQVVIATEQADNAFDSATAAAASAASAAEIVGGTIKASQAEAEAATDDLKYMTPLQVKNEVQKSGAVLIPAANVVLTGKQDALGYTPENVVNKDTDGTLAANSDTKYPSQKAVKTAIDTKANKGANSDITSLSGLTTPLSAAQGGTGVTTGIPAQVGLGSWVDKSSSYGAQQAATDGFVVVNVNGTNSTDVRAFTDSNVDPSTLRGRLDLGNETTWLCLTMPVKKGDYWKITVSSQISITVYWIPLGS